MNHLSELNDAQKEAVKHTAGPLLIVAGAGAGKTKTITHRILHLVKHGVAPNHILAITFTNKAAQEMRARILTLLREDPELNLPISFSEQPVMSTFHALGARMLREESEAVGLSKHFAILDTQDTSSLLKEAITSAGLDPKQFEPKRIRATISREKGNMVTAQTYAESAGNEYFPRIVSVIWTEYEKLLAKHKGVDFDDLILKTAALLERDTTIRKKYHDRWRYLHIDEYQDTNIAQYKLSKLLTGPAKNICVVGDMDQSIYSWRGADFRNIMNFEEDYPHAHVVLLEENYRSTKTILAAANEIIKKNTARKEKNLFTRKEDGEKIGLFQAYDESEEAYFIAQKAGTLIRNGIKPNNIAVLYRANFQSRVLEEAFLEAGIPYQVLGVKFFERKEVKDILSFLRAGLNPDSLADIKRIVNVPPRGIGKATLVKIFANQEKTLSPAFKAKVHSFHTLIESIGQRATKIKPSELISYIARESGLSAHLKKGGEEDRERLENIGELVTLATKYDEFSPEEGVERLLEDASLASDQDSLNTTQKNEKNAVRLMTVHAAKGLEFPYVFIAGMEQDLFPHGGFGGTDDTERAEEERRLFYVAVTRAEKKLILSFASVRTVFGMKQVNVPSEFITDISDEFMDTETIVDTITTE